jgi:predicted acyl esterase
VYPDGRAYNLDESIQRMRYRDGYDKPPVMMKKDSVYKVTLQPSPPATTSRPVTGFASRFRAATSRASIAT